VAGAARMGRLGMGYGGSGWNTGESSRSFAVSVDEPECETEECLVEYERAATERSMFASAMGGFGTGGAPASLAPPQTTLLSSKHPEF
jgi:hypothetical protein